MTTKLITKKASQQTTLSPSVLRILELRYKWPRPAQRVNGYRAYKAEPSEDLKLVAGRIVDSQAISELVCEGELVRDDPSRRNKPAPNAGIDFSSIMPLPVDADKVGWVLGRIFSYRGSTT